MATPSPDDRFHRCIYYPLAPIGGPVYESAPKTKCSPWRLIHSTWGSGDDPGTAAKRPGERPARPPGRPPDETGKLAAPASVLAATPADGAAAYGAATPDPRMPPRSGLGARMPPRPGLGGYAGIVGVRQTGLLPSIM